ncbi:hypothetical protein HPB49_017834 [Dermacentor silvarum]|uniref:Uncharacterized protein n=1 Tax=Dermacentor silvarum TaxID=543639 RepID=A0ACB8CM82_DERSI|nr:hypothetical protein HPB49_017834 [Dermacentor silvarum]
MTSPLKSYIDPTEHPFDTRRNFGEYMVQHLRRHAGSKLINGTSHEAFTYGEVAEQVDAVRTALWRLGHEAGDKILLLSANRTQFLPMFLGAACANVASVSESPGFSVDVLADAMQTLSLVCVCCEPDRVQEALELQRRLVSIKHIIVLDEPAHKMDGTTNSIITWNELLKKGREEGSPMPPPAEYRENQICYMTSTSGRAWSPPSNKRQPSNNDNGSGPVNVRALAEIILRFGKPKQERNANAGPMKEFDKPKRNDNDGPSRSHPGHMGLGPEDVSLSTTSLSHVYALFDGVCKAIAQGASAAFMETADDTAILEAIHKHRVTAMSTTPYTVRCLLDNERRKGYDLDCLQYVTTATTIIGEDVAKTLVKEFNLKSFIQLYGQSEIPFISAGLYNAPSKYKSIGCLAVGVQAVCYYDNDGWLYLVARLSDFFCCRGGKYWPAEVEAVLLKCPEVHDCAVVGMPHPEAGEVAHALVVPEPEARTLSADDVMQFVEG